MLSYLPIRQKEREKCTEFEMIYLLLRCFKINKRSMDDSKPRACNYTN